MPESERYPVLFAFRYRGQRGVSEYKTPIDWVEKKTTPDSRPLQYCSWHSGGWCFSTPRTKDHWSPVAKRCYHERYPEFAVWDSELDAYDTCYLQDEKFQRESESQRSISLRFLNNIHEIIAKAKIAHETFFERVKMLNLQETQLVEIRKEIQKKSQGPNLKNAEYQRLLQLSEKANENLSRSEANLKTKANPELFLASLEEEKSRARKADEDLQRWLNKNTASDISELRLKEQELILSISSLRERLPVEVKGPFYLIRETLALISELYLANLDPLLGRPLASGYGGYYDPFDRYLRETINNFRRHLNDYSQYIPESEQEKTFQEMRQNQINLQKQEQTALQKIRRVEVQASQLGDLVIGLDGKASEINLKSQTFTSS